MMTADQCRSVEAMYFSSGRCLWPDDQIAAAMLRWEERIRRLEAGDAIDNSEPMGSCQCGDVASSLFLRDGVVWCRSSGREEWQRYDGPAARCNVPYGVGTRARQLAAAWAASR